MTQYLLMCRSLTYAQKAARILERSGYTVTVIKAPQALSSGGCAYAITLRANISDVKQILKRYDVPYDKVFMRDENSDYREEQK